MGSHGGAAEAVRVRLLGGFSVSVGSRGVEADGWRRRSAASLVKVLALARGHRLRRDRILDLLWPKLDQKTAAGNLHRSGGADTDTATDFTPSHGDTKDATIP